jgi:hypothetical protein
MKPAAIANSAIAMMPMIVGWEARGGIKSLRLALSGEKRSPER